jgi:hypothetical protein
MNGFENQPERRKPGEYPGRVGSTCEVDLGYIRVNIKSLLSDVRLVADGWFTPWSYEEIDIMVENIELDPMINGLDVDTLRDSLRAQLKKHAWWIDLVDVIEGAVLSMDLPETDMSDEFIIRAPDTPPTTLVGTKNDNGDLVFGMGWADTNPAKLAGSISLLTECSATAHLRKNFFTGGKKVVFLDTNDETYMFCNDDFLILDKRVLEFLGHDNLTLARQCAAFIVDAAHKQMGIQPAKSVPFILDELVYYFDPSTSMSLPVYISAILS